jgi:hypothetical protein
VGPASLDGEKPTTDFVGDCAFATSGMTTTLAAAFISSLREITRASDPAIAGAASVGEWLENAAHA